MGKFFTRPATAAAFEVIPTGAALGAEVGAGDLRTLDHAGFARVLEAWRAHAVVLFRNQALSDRDLIAFSRRFGDLDWAPSRRVGLDLKNRKPCWRLPALRGQGRHKSA